MPLYQQENLDCEESGFCAISMEAQFLVYVLHNVFVTHLVGLYHLHLHHTNRAQNMLFLSYEQSLPVDTKVFLFAI